MNKIIKILSFSFLLFSLLISCNNTEEGKNKDTPTRSAEEKIKEKLEELTSLLKKIDTSKDSKLKTLIDNYITNIKNDIKNIDKGAYKNKLKEEQDNLLKSASNLYNIFKEKIDTITDAKSFEKLKDEAKEEGAFVVGNTDKHNNTGAIRSKLSLEDTLKHGITIYKKVHEPGPDEDNIDFGYSLYSFYDGQVEKIGIYEKIATVKSLKVRTYLDKGTYTLENKNGKKILNLSFSGKELRTVFDTTPALSKVHGIDPEDLQNKKEEIEVESKETIINGYHNLIDDFKKAIDNKDTDKVSIFYQFSVYLSHVLLGKAFGSFASGFIDDTIYSFGPSKGTYKPKGYMLSCGPLINALVKSCGIGGIYFKYDNFDVFPNYKITGGYVGAANAMGSKGHDLKIEVDGSEFSLSYGYDSITVSDGIISSGYPEITYSDGTKINLNTSILGL